MAGGRGLVVPVRGVAPSQVRREPSDQISVKGCVTDCCDELCMVYSGKGFKQVNCYCHCAERFGARFVKTCFHFVSKRQQNESGGSVFAETVFGFR